MKWLTGFLPLFVFLACSKPRPEIPDGVLKEKEMIPLLVDLHIAQAATDMFGRTDSLPYKMNDYLPFILKIHNVEKAIYDSSLSFYLKYPELMQEMYDSVITELSRKQGESQAGTASSSKQ